jgi:hypothetical protein
MHPTGQYLRHWGFPAQESQSLENTGTGTSGKPIISTFIRAFFGLKTFSFDIAQASSHKRQPMHMSGFTDKNFLTF